MLDIEAQRQRERLKLIEMERKKRDMALAKSNDPNTNTSTSNKENKNNVVQIKRVNIASPTATDKDQLAPLEVAQKKPTRKPKFKRPSPAPNDTSSQASGATPRADDRLELPVIPSKTSTKSSKTPTSSSLNDEHHQQQQPPQPSSRISQHNPKAKSPAVPKEINNQKEPIQNNVIIETITSPSTNNNNNNNQQQSLAKQHQQLQPNTPISNASSTKPHQVAAEQKPVIAKIERPVIKEVKEPSNKMKRQVCCGFFIFILGFFLNILITLRRSQTSHILQKNTIS